MSGFRCLHSGKCCELVYTQISLTLGDIRRIAEFTRVSPEQLFAQKVVGLSVFGISDMHYETELGLTIPCSFRKDKRCCIYEARPLNCRLFPYWILSEASPERILEIVDESYECVHKVRMTKELKEKYKRYTLAVSKILEDESEVTDRLLSHHDLNKIIDISQSPSYDRMLAELTISTLRLAGVARDKVVEEAKIRCALGEIPQTLQDDARTAVASAISGLSGGDCVSSKELNALERLKG